MERVTVGGVPGLLPMTLLFPGTTLSWDSSYPLPLPQAGCCQGLYSHLKTGVQAGCRMLEGWNNQKVTCILHTLINKRRLLVFAGSSPSALGLLPISMKRRWLLTPCYPGAPAKNLTPPPKEHPRSQVVKGSSSRFFFWFEEPLFTITFFREPPSTPATTQQGSLPQTSTG